MITNYKRKDLQNIIDGDSELYNVSNLVADQLRTIYTTLGWTHMTEKFGSSRELVDDLTVHSLKRLVQSPDDDSSVMSAGLSVSSWLDSDGFLNIDYSFNII